MHVFINSLTACQGLIIGTGTNVCYYEQLDRVEKWKDTEIPKYKVGLVWYGMV